jgi:hypothetical protein
MFQCLNKDCQMFIKEQGQKLSLEQLIERAQNFTDAHEYDHKSSNDGNKYSKSKAFKKYDHRNGKSDSSAETCSKPSNTQTWVKKTDDKEDQKAKSSENRPQTVCFLCKKTGHKFYQCELRKKTGENTVTQHKAALCKTETHISHVFPVVALSVTDDDNEYLPDLKSPYRGKAKVNNQSVRFLRDSGATLSLVKIDLCKPDQFTGTKTSVILADGKIRYYPEVEIEVHSPCFTGTIKALAMADPVESLVLGNNIFQKTIKVTPLTDNGDEDDDCVKLPNKTVIFENSVLIPPEARLNEPQIMGSEEINSSKPTVNLTAVQDSMSIQKDRTEEKVNNCNAVQTRVQKAREVRSLKPLQFSAVQALNISRDEFLKLQKDDASLQKYWRIAESNMEEDGKISFIIKEGILFRVYEDESAVKTEQLMVPTELREKTVLFAHESILAGHMGIASTYKKLCTEFYFPGAYQLIKRLVSSCKLCQQGANKNVHGKAQLHSLPVISTPFHTVYIDLVGKISPASSEGHTHILTILDAATTYFIGVPLKKTDSVTIAESLMHVFNQYGYAKNIYSDNGSNLSSEVLDEIYRTLGVERKAIPVYWPRVNRVERFHGTMKQILRKFVIDEPKQWHRYLDPLLFAIRTTPTCSGYSSFELLFGREPRTHLTFLRELWSGQDNEPEGKVIFQYVLDLQNKITQTCEFAQKELAKIRERNYKIFNKNARTRVLKPGQKVWVINTKCESKFDFSWVGPAMVLEKKGKVTYKIQFENGDMRLYHINMLKPFIEREDKHVENSKNKLSNVSRPKSGDSATASNDDDPMDYNNDGNDDCIQMNAVAEIDELSTFSRTKQTNNAAATDEYDLLDHYDGCNDNCMQIAAAAEFGFIEVSDDQDQEEIKEHRDRISLKQDLTELPIPNLVQTENWKNVVVNPDLSAKQQKEAWKLIEEFQEIFSDVPTQTNLLTCKLKVKSDEPIRHKPYSIPVHLKSAVDAELDKMLKMKWIELADADNCYASPLVVVKKKGTNDLRLCVSYKDLNNLLEVDVTPIPDMQDILADIGKSRFFSTTDAAKGFYAIAIEPEFRKYTGFVYQNNHFVHCVLPFGLSISPGLYSKMMQKLLYGAKNLANFIDDVIGYNSDFESHLATLRDLFQRVRDANLKLKPSKTKIGFREIAYLGKIVGNGEIRPTQENIESILNAPIPKTKKGVRSLTGAINWLRQYIPSAAQLMKPINSLLTQGKGEAITWGEEQQRAWEEIKCILTSKPVLSLYDQTKEHRICTDASVDCIGGVLMQLEEDNKWHPVFYVSRKCNKAEANYDIQNKEALAVIYCFSKFYRFVYGKPFSLQVDSAALCVLNNKFSNNARVRRWQLYLQSFQYHLVVVTGKENPLADLMTRLGT